MLPLIHWNIGLLLYSTNQVHKYLHSEHCWLYVSLLINSRISFTRKLIIFTLFTNHHYLGAVHNICWHHCLNHFTCNIALNIWSLEDWVVLVTSNCGSRTLFVRTFKVFFTFYAPVPGPQSLFNLTSRHQVVTCTLFPVYAGKRRPVFAPAANFQQLIALKVISPEHRSAFRHYYLTQTKKVPFIIHPSDCLSSLPPVWVLSAPLSILGCSCFLAPFPSSPWCIDPISLRRQTLPPKSSIQQCILVYESVLSKLYQLLGEAVSVQSSMQY